MFGEKSNKFLGGCGFHPRTLNLFGLEIGYWIRTSAANKGLATRVTQCLIVYGFEYLKLSRIQCGHNSNNVASARVNEKCGLKIEGRFKNFETMPTELMKKNGWAGSAENIVRGLYPEDVPQLDWYGKVQKSMIVYDWLGRPNV